MSRLYKIGTIYTRVDGLLRNNGLKPNEKPLWFDVYTHFPPMFEPTFNREVPDIKIKNILYEEDNARAKIHKKFGNKIGLIDLERPGETKSQRLLKEYQNYIAEGKTENEALDSLSDKYLKKTTDSKKDTLKITELFKDR